MLSDLAFALRAQADQLFVSAVLINYSRNVFNAVVIYFNSIFFEQVEKNVQKKHDNCSFCWMLNHWKKDCKKLQTLIKNKHIYVNDELFFKICKNKSKNVEFSLRLSKDMNQLNEILSAFELNASVYSSVWANVLSIAVDTFEIAANHTYNSIKKEYRLFRIEVLNQKKKEQFKSR